MDAPRIARKEPFGLTLESGKTYAWCACGLSQKQPFCDGAHKVTAFKPVVFKQEKTEEVWLCGCKQTKDRPFCDGTHNGL
jgi:CDGSH iron-sulfur domain-containing protein 3